MIYDFIGALLGGLFGGFATYAICLLIGKVVHGK